MQSFFVPNSPLMSLLVLYYPNLSFCVLTKSVSFLISPFPSLLVRGGSRIFFRRGCTRLSLYFNTNKPHSHIVFFFFCRIPVILENRRSSQGEGGVRTPCTLPLDPPLLVLNILTNSLPSLLVLVCPYLFFYVLTCYFLSLLVLFCPYLSFSVLPSPFMSLLVLFCPS